MTGDIAAESEQKNSCSVQQQRTTVTHKQAQPSTIDDALCIMHVSAVKVAVSFSDFKFTAATPTPNMITQNSERPMLHAPDTIYLYRVIIDLQHYCLHTGGV